MGADEWVSSHILYLKSLLRIVFLLCCILTNCCAIVIAVH